MSCNVISKFKTETASKLFHKIPADAIIIKGRNTVGSNKFERIYLLTNTDIYIFKKCGWISRRAELKQSRGIEIFKATILLRVNWHLKSACSLPRRNWWL